MHHTHARHRRWAGTDRFGDGPAACAHPRGTGPRDRRRARRDPARDADGGQGWARLRVHRRRARLDDVHGQPLPLRPRLVEHPGRLHQRVDRGPAGPVSADQRLRARQRPSRNGAARARIQVRARRGRLPQAVLGHPPRGPHRPAPADRRGPCGDHGRNVQRAEHQPDPPGNGHPELRARHRLSARRHGRVTGHRLAARRVRPRPAVPRHGRRRRTDVEFLGARAASPVGADGRRRRPRAHAVRQRIRVDGAVGPRTADALHARPLRGGVVDGLVGVARGGREADVRPVRWAEKGGADA